MPKNALTYTRQHAPTVVLTRSMSPQPKMVSPMRSAATWILSAFRCRNLNGTSVELISPVIKCFCAACLDLHCRSIKCTRCKKAVTMTGLNPFDASCLFEYTIGQASMIGRKRSSETYLRMHLGEPIEYTSIRKTIHRGYTLTKWTRVNWMSFDDSWTSFIDLAELEPFLRLYGAGCLLVKKANGKWRMCVDYEALNTRTVRDRYPLPSIQSILSTLGGSTVFSKIDLVSGFHQIRIHDEDIKKAAVKTQFRMGFYALWPL